MKCLRRVATSETGELNRRYATRTGAPPDPPALKGRAKFMPTLRVDEPD